ncbi:MAG: 2-C-methyl-D-erythritol 2,4-cyclodiphosphate synthase [Oscillospiraceae bacterium]|jgi:2-C-methyl-D-erythritol 4-phosphate cytidylyltransferase/2-C-methyl-D-erythritol 2,4-cyclodiphosphate synthase|nr:2-C-methyl-D-erythritol 2,4-cyclodiphosphate synthase [Oscillospiraceae bacterium]
MTEMNCKAKGRWLVLAASGRGTRSGLPINKAFFPVDGICPLARCLIAFREHAQGAVICISESDEGEFAKIKPVCDLIMPYRIAYGGETRADSVRSGLASLGDECELVAIHDAARPYVTGELIERVFAAAEESGAAIPAISVTDTVVSAEEDVRYLNRDNLRAVQTPQAFRKSIIAEAYASVGADGFTDDGSVAAAAGHPVAIVEGEQTNIKLTYAHQFCRGEPPARPLSATFAHSREPRASPWLAPTVTVGFGYDVHQLVQGRALVLCGVTVPHTRGLLGHSDADAAMHALCDAILGAASLGDIGKHFPDSDPAYGGIYSVELLKRVVNLVESRGFRVNNADITIAAQRPKIAKYIGDMRNKLAESMRIDVNYVSVKATTTERLGFVGREEGIAAYAVCSLTHLVGGV